MKNYHDLKPMIRKTLYIGYGNAALIIIFAIIIFVKVIMNLKSLETIY